MKKNYIYYIYMRHFAVKMKLTKHGKSTILQYSLFLKRAKKLWEIGHRRRRQVDTEAKQVLKMVEGTMKQGMQPKSLWHFVTAAKKKKKKKNQIQHLKCNEGLFFLEAFLYI